MERAIRVLGDIKDLSDLLQGASLDQVKLVPAAGRLRLELELTRACLELPGRKPIPQVKSRLVLGQIRDAGVQRVDDGSPGRLSLLACDAVSGGYVLSVMSHDGLKLVLTLEQLEGEFADLGQPAAAR